ncbi:MAG: ABC transporter ATP-binding protein [Chloroflexi bacterium]|nr:ABC transporter ATP-binding protein [Chloroflexota bacterium]
MKILFRIVGIALRHKWHLIGAYSCMAGAVVAYLLMPAIFGNAIDKIYDIFKDGGVTQLPEGEILVIVLVILGLSIIRGVLSFWQTYLGEALSQYVAYDIRNDFYDHVQRMSFGFHDRHHTGNLMSRAITDVENIRMFINMGLVRTPYFLTLFIVVAIILLRLDWKLGLLSTSFLPFVAYNSAVVRLRMRAIWLSVQEKMAELNTVLQENLTGVRVVKAFAAEEYEEGKYNTRNAEVAEDMVAAEKLRASNTSFMTFVFLIALALILWIGGRQVINGNMTPGELAEFIFYMQILSMPVRMTGWMVNAYARATSAGERLFEIIDTESPVQELPDAREMPRANGHVRFENVSFSYDNGVPVLKNINIDVEPGKVIALLGAPGSGKSTIVNLISRFYDVASGRITIDGIDISEVTLESLRRNVGFVQQDVFLFTTSMRENIAYGRESAPMDEIIQAAGVAQLHEFITSLDEGYDTQIGERGSTLSGGQRQRMSIARAVLLDPPVLILDDSTSSVDANTEDQIRRAMESVMRGRTTFVIAHRLSTVHRADMILVMQDGEIAEQGTHQELLAKGGLYRDIYELQLRPQEEVMREIEAPVMVKREGSR